MPIKDVLSRLRRFDAYPKTLDDFRVKTFGGAAVTIVSSIIMFTLFIAELNYYLTKEVHQELFVDSSKGHKLRINIDIVFPRIGCSFLSVDAMDVSGDQQIDVDHDVFKERLDLDGNLLSDKPLKEEIGDKGKEMEMQMTSPATTLDPNRCESCYGAETARTLCCNTCEEVRDAYRKRGWAFTNAHEMIQCQRDGWTEQLSSQQNEGCRVYGYVLVNKVAGNFHIAPGKSFQQHHAHVHDMQALSSQKFNLTHKVNHLSFGKDYPGQTNPLDNTSETADKPSIMFQYFVKIVPTTYVQVSGEVLYTNQYSVTKHQKMVSGGLLGEQGLPGVFIMYELSPMMVKYTEKHRSFMHFLSGVCAIIGGIFTVASLIDATIYHSARVIQKKIELGKIS